MKKKKSSKDDLALIVADNLNKEFKDYKVAYFLDQNPPTTVVDWISTGNDVLDIAVSNKKHAGIPVGKITEITGLEASGKSLLAAHLLASTQKKGGMAVFIDTESATSTEFLEAIGVDNKNILYCQLDLIEDIFQTIENIITTVRESSSDRLVTIVVDSVAGSSSKVEMEADFDKDGWATAKAIIISKAMRKLTNLIARQKIAVVFTNQLRQKMNAMFGDQYTESGGFGLRFHSSLIIRVQSIGAIKDKNGVVIGMKCKALIKKNRMGPPLRTVTYEMYFASGIDNHNCWLTVGKDHGFIKSSGAWYTTKDHKGKALKFQAKEWASLLEKDSEFKEFIYDQMADALIMKYKPTSVNVDEIEVAVGEIDE